jgi:hypothetical protein
MSETLIHVSPVMAGIDGETVSVCAIGGTVVLYVDDGNETVTLRMKPAQWRALMRNSYLALDIAETWA